MDDQQRDELRERNRRRAYCCPKCGGPSLETVDGSKCGGMPGINYKICRASEPGTLTAGQKAWATRLARKAAAESAAA